MNLTGDRQKHHITGTHILSDTTCQRQRLIEQTQQQYILFSHIHSLKQVILSNQDNFKSRRYAEHRLCIPHRPLRSKHIHHVIKLITKIKDDPPVLHTRLLDSP
jgi:hypothetical protein